MDLDNNIVPGRSKVVTAIRRVANSIRTCYMLNIKPGLTGVELERLFVFL